MQNRAKSRKRPAEIDLGQEIGKSWEDVRITPIGLSIPCFKRPFTIEELRALFWRMQTLNRLEFENVRLKKERAAAWQAQAAAEDRAEYYRRQLRLESSSGAMLARIFTTMEE